MKKILLIIGFLGLISTNLYAQRGKAYEKKWTASGGFAFSGPVFFDFNVLYATLFPGAYSPNWYAYKAGLQVSSVNEKAIFGPNIGGEASFSIFALRASAITYLQSGEPTSFYIVPEIGLSLGSKLSITFGMNIPAVNKIEGIDNTRITILFAGI